MSNWPVSVQDRNGGKSTSLRNGAETCVSFACKAVSAERGREKRRLEPICSPLCRTIQDSNEGSSEEERDRLRREPQKNQTSLWFHSFCLETHIDLILAFSLFPFPGKKKWHYSVLSTKTNRLLNKGLQKNTNQWSTDVTINSLCK